MKKTISITAVCLILSSILIAGPIKGDPIEAVEDSLIINEDIVEARKDFIRRLLVNNKYREAVDELLELRSEVPKKTSLFIDLWIGGTYMNIADYINRGLMIENEYGNLIYREEVDIIYYTAEEKELLRAKVKGKKDYFTREELKKIDHELIDSYPFLDNEIAKIYQDEEIRKADKSLSGSELPEGNMYIPWDEGGADVLEEESVSEETILSGTVSRPKENIETRIKKVNKVVKKKLRGSALKYYELAIKHFNRVIRVLINNDYREKAILKKAETFYRMYEHSFSLAEYDYFIKSFPKSNKVVDALIAKGNILTDMKEYRSALKVFSQTLEAYPETKRKNYIRLKIKYLNILLGEAQEGGAGARAEVERKLKILEEFEKEIKRKEERLQEIEDLTK